MELLANYPDEDFPFSGLCISENSKISQETRLVRILIESMKSFGLNMLVSAPTLEIKDTAKILGVNSDTNTYYLSKDYEKNKTIWSDALNHAKESGSSIILLDAKDDDSRNFLLANVSETIDFVDFVKLTNASH